MVGAGAIGLFGGVSWWVRHGGMGIYNGMEVEVRLEVRLEIGLAYAGTKNR